jgi:cobalt-zinc-cadmium efflux system outer membrane protein
MRLQEYGSPLRKVPTAARTFALLAGAVAAFVSSGKAQAQQSEWSESDIVRMARARAPQVVVARRQTALAEANMRSTGRPPDPSVSWRREETFGGNNPNNEDIIALTWPVDLSGRRRARRALARSELAGAEMNAAVTQRAAIARALGAFYRVVAARQRVRAAEARVELLQEVDRVLAERQAAGAASGYDRARFGIEADLARSQLASRQTEAKTARAQLRTLVAPDAPELPAVDGELTTRAPAEVEALIERAERSHPALRHADASEQAARNATQAADTAWIPVFSLTGGYKVARTAQTQHGYVVGGRLSLPLFSRDRGLDERASARRRLAEAQTEALRRRLRQRVTQARTRLVAARKELARFERSTADRVEKLLRGARVSYEQGRRPLSDVLDAQRAATDVRLRRVALALEAKRAETDLRQVTGGW